MRIHFIEEILIIRWTLHIPSPTALLRRKRPSQPCEWCHTRAVVTHSYQAEAIKTFFFPLRMWVCARASIVIGHKTRTFRSVQNCWKWIPNELFLNVKMISTAQQRWSFQFGFSIIMNFKLHSYYEWQWGGGERRMVHASQLYFRPTQLIFFKHFPATVHFHNSMIYGNIYSQTRL